MFELVLCVVFALLLSTISGAITLPFLRKIKAGQPILKYVKEHEYKSGTPTMGGLFMILSAVVIFMIFGGWKSRIALISVGIGLAFMVVGLLDDFLKIKLKKNEGLKAYQKILFQSSIAIFAGIFSYVNGLTVFFVPFSRITVDLSFWTIPIVAIIFIAITNSVNLTDGLDGLAGSVSIGYLIFISLLIILQTKLFEHLYLIKPEYDNLVKLSACLIGGILGFLVYNSNKARVFMGDTGSLSIGGFIGGISVFSSNSFFMPILGIMFVLSSISVIIQVFWYKRTKKRVFLMAPIHHHFQHKGYSETQITYCYFLITCVLGMLALLTYL